MIDSLREPAAWRNKSGQPHLHIEWNRQGVSEFVASGALEKRCATANKMIEYNGGFESEKRNGIGSRPVYRHVHFPKA
jgi:hypothetical protein